MAEYILSAWIFGLTAGLKPGPLWLLIVQQSLEHGMRQGGRAAFAPALSDGPIILGALLVMTRFDDVGPFIAALSLVGGGYLLWLAIKLGTRGRPRLTMTSDTPRSLTLAIKVNLLNPNPYLFWFSVGGSYFAAGSAREIAVFIGVFTGSLIGASLAVAWIAARFRPWLESASYQWAMRALALLLAGFGGLLIIQGLVGSLP